MALPPQRPRRRWGIIVGWVLFAFAGGVAVGPGLADYADVAVNGTAAFLGKHAPWMLGKYRPAPTSLPPAPAYHASRPLPPPALPAAPVVAPTVVAQPTITPTPPSPAAKATEPARPSATGRAAGQRAAAAFAAEIAASEEPAARRGHTRNAPKAPTVAVAAPTKKSGKSRDPFEEGAGSGSGPAAAPKPEPKPAPAARSEPAPRPAARSSDGLDNLMADVVTENKGKGKRSTSKDIDAMLKDVQKSEPAPAPKKAAAPAELPPLSPADIARVMGKVKTRANGCGQQFGDHGMAELKVTVGKDGKVSDVDVGGKIGETKTAACVAKAVRAAVFPPNSGLRFDYRIDVH